MRFTRAFATETSGPHDLIPTTTVQVMRIAVDVRVMAVFIMATAGLHMHLLTQLQTAKHSALQLQLQLSNAAVKTPITPEKNRLSTTENATLPIRKEPAATPAPAASDPAVAGVANHRVAAERAAWWKFPVYYTHTQKGQSGSTNN